MIPESINWSSLKHLATSPRLYRWRVDHPEAPKPAYVLGAAGHCLVLEPDKFDGRYAEYSGTRRGKAWEAWQEEHPGIQSLKPDELATVRAVAESVQAHPVASEILRHARHEEPLEWTDPDTGLRCRGRVDAIDSARIVELKLTRHVDPRRFARASADFLYHGQLSMYHTGATTLGKIDGQTLPVIIAAENIPPFDVAVYQVKPADLEAGRNLVLSLMRRLEECVAADWWPGVAPDLQYLELPPWAPGLGNESEEW